MPLSGNRQMIKKPVKKFLYLHRHLDRYQSLTSCGQSHILPFPKKKIQRNSPTTFCVILLYRQTHKGKNMTVFTQECTLVSQKGNSGVDLSQDMGSRSVRSSHQTVSDYTLSSILIHWSLSFTHKLSRLSKSLTALFGMRHLTYGTNFLHRFAFLVSRPPQSALLHRRALTLLLNRWLACLTGSSILVLKLTFSPYPFPRNLPLSLTD